MLVGLLVIATPFALSMRHLESGALLEREQESARAGALVAVAAARRHLEDSHPFYDLDSPHRDLPAELSPPDLERRFAGQLGRDPTGVLRSVRIEDERGKVHLGTASPWLLGNLLGGRTQLAEDVGDDDSLLPVRSDDGFAPAGLLWVGAEVVEYSGLGGDAFDECRRGFASDNLITSLARPHVAGTEVLDFRLLLLAEHGWRLRPGVFEVFRRVDGLKEIGLYGEMTYTAAELERVRPYLTVHGDGPVWRREQPVRQVFDSDVAAPELLLADARGYGPGTIVELTDAEGEREWSLVTRVMPWDGGHRVRLLEPLLLRHGDGLSRVRALRREPVNVNTCALPVLVALLTGLGRPPVQDVITAHEAIALAEVLAAASAQGLKLEVQELRHAVKPAIALGRFSQADLLAAVEHLGARFQPAGMELADIAHELVGLETLQAPQPIGRASAERVAARLRAAGPGSHEDLRAVVDLALAAGEISATDRELILRNALDPGDLALVGGTAPFCYASRDVYTLEAAASENLPNGRERARAHVREVVSVAPAGDAVRVFATQRDLEEAAARSSGWAGWGTGPELLVSGAGGAVVADVAAAGNSQGVFASGLDLGGIEDLAGEWGAALDQGRRLPGRSETLLLGRVGPSDREPGTVLEPSSVRSALPGTVHFDEGARGLMGDSPAGLDFARGPVVLPVAGLVPALAGSQGLLSPFSVEFWFELDDVEAETILFDGGSDELEDRILIVMSDGELVARVHDTSIVDFEAEVPEGRVPPTGEIRYAFDDGLVLQPGVPYHVALYVGGSRGSSMGLFVDGVARGRRSFTTRLVEGLGLTGGGTLIGSDTTEILVESTAGFPRRGVLRIGPELVEYIDLDERHFIVAQEDGEDDTFGGRAKRRTPGVEHDVGEMVELFGYTLPVFSEMLARGDGQLAAQMDEFSVAQLDGSALNSPIEVELTTLLASQTVQIGTGLLATESTLPLRAAGSAPLSQGTFSASGGYALLMGYYEDYYGFDTELLVQGSVGNLTETATGDQIGGFEIVHYTGFNGSALTGCSRGSAGIPASVGPIPSDLEEGEVSDLRVSGSFQDSRVFVTEFDAAVVNTGLYEIPEEPTVIVVPLSIPLVGSDLWNDYHPLPQEADPEASRAALVQLDLDFADAASSTEWARWDTATSDALVRDDIDAVNALATQYTGLDVWDPEKFTPDEDWVEVLNDEIDFRGQVGTVDGQHLSGADVRPVHVVGGFGVDFFDPAMSGAPGRHDAVTLVSDEGEKEWHRVNHGGDDALDWGGYWLFALRDPVLGEFVRTDVEDADNYRAADLDLDDLLPPDSPYRDTIAQLQRESRLYTRVLKAPSGELPSVTPPAFLLGADYAGRPSRGGAIVDELRFHVAETPGPLLPKTGRYVLSEEIEHGRLILDLERLLLPDGLLDDPLLEPDALAAVRALPQGGGLLLLGEEIVSYAGMDAETTGTVYLAGRGLYGTREQVHQPGEPVTPLLFWPAVPLSEDITATSAVLPLVERGTFPDAPGLLWVDDELIGYTGHDPQLVGLSMPGDRGATRITSRGLLRGRHGTAAASHEAGALVRWMPERHRDQALLGAGGPASHVAGLGVSAPGAFFTDLALDLLLPDPGVGLAARVVLDQGVSPHADPDDHVDLLELVSAPDAVGQQRLLGSVGRQADRLDLYLYARWLPGAFDPLEFTAQGWKLAPEVRRVVIAHDQPTLVLEHEEWR